MRIIKKYQEFLREAVYAPPPPAYYYKFDKKVDTNVDKGENYMFQTGVGDTILSSDWGIEGANLPKTYEGWHSSNDAFIVAYTKYLNDSTGTNNGYVGKTLLLFETKNGKEGGTYILNGKFAEFQTDVNYYYVTKDAVKYKVESSFLDGQGNLSIWSGEKATRSFDLATGQMLVSKWQYDDLVKNDEINTQNVVPSAEQLSDVNISIHVGNNGAVMKVTEGVPAKMKITYGIEYTKSDTPVVIKNCGGNQRYIYLTDFGDVHTGIGTWEYLPEIIAKYGAKPTKLRLAVPGADRRNMKTNIEGYGTVYRYKEIYAGTTQGHILYKAIEPEEVSDSSGNTAQRNHSAKYYSIPLNVYNRDGEDINVLAPFKTDNGKIALQSVYNKDKVIEVEWDANKKRFVSDLKTKKSKDVTNPDGGDWVIPLKE